MSIKILFLLEKIWAENENYNKIWIRNPSTSTTANPSQDCSTAALSTIEIEYVMQCHDTQKSGF